MTTIGNSLSVVTLSASALNVTVTGTIDAYGTVGAYTIGGTLTVPDAALFGPAGSHFTVTNVGLIESHGASSTNKNDAGIFLASLGTVINKGKILGAEGIQMLGTSGVGFLDNTGFIEGSIGSGVVFSDVATLINSGTILSGGNNGAYLRGGRVVNSGEIIGYKHGISTTLAPVTVVNSGEIIATGTSFENDGTMDFSHGIVLQDGGRVTNTSKGTIIGEQGIVIDTIAGGYVYNAGQVTGVSHSAIYLEESGVVVNAKGGTVSGRTGIDLDDGGTVRNSGIVLAVRSAVYLKDGGAVVNTGQVTAGGSGVYDLGGPGAAKIENEKHATIYGSIAGVDLIGPGSVYNAGTIGGTNGVNFMVAEVSTMWGRLTALISACWRRRG
jgi:hypothetical protein